MMAFSGSISAQGGPGKLEPNCENKVPKVGMRTTFRITDSRKGEAIIVHREKSDEPWRAICTLIIDVDSAFIKRFYGGSYFATVNNASGVAKGEPLVLRKGYLVKWVRLMDGDLFEFTTADGKKEIGRLNVMLDNPKNTPR